jgi:L-rhamnose isomerase/sugar isomerase
MIDQSHNIKPKIEAMIQTVVFLQGAYARSLLIDEAQLRAAQQAGDVVGAETLLQQAFQTDVEPLLAQLRLEMGRPQDPLASHRVSGYEGRVAQERQHPISEAGGWA